MSHEPKGAGTPPRSNCGFNANGTKAWSGNSTKHETPTNPESKKNHYTNEKTDSIESDEALAGNKNAIKLLNEIKLLDNKLFEIKKRLVSFKTESIENSIFTPENINASIQLIKTISPNDTGTINALIHLLTLSRNKQEDLHEKGQEVTYFQRYEEPNVNLAKLKSIVPQNKLI